eukprot:3812858-Prorocentrum_lima.AAC.1
MAVAYTEMEDAAVQGHGVRHQSADALQIDQLLCFIQSQLQTVVLAVRWNGPQPPEQTNLSF